jgi:CO/xanthine dehydrogenase FAD-binding subunit
MHLDEFNIYAKLKQVINFVGSLVEWYRPMSLAELIELRHRYPGKASKLVFGNTRVYIERKHDQAVYPCLVSLAYIDELKQLEHTKHSFILGAGVTLTRLQTVLTVWKHEMTDIASSICQALLDQLIYFGSTQIRNVASIGGNIINPLSM